MTCRGIPGITCYPCEGGTYAPDVFIKPGTEKVGYELSFTKYFYKPIQLRTLEEIARDIRAIEKETDGLLDEILGG